MQITITKNPDYHICVTIGDEEFLPWKNLTEEKMWEHMLDMSPLKVISWLVQPDFNVFDEYHIPYATPIMISVLKGTAQFWRIDLIPAERVEYLVKLVDDKMKQEAYIRDKQAINNKYDKEADPINDKYYIDVKALEDKRDKESKPFIDTYNESTKVFRDVLVEHLNPLDHKLWESLRPLEDKLWESIKPFRDKRDKSLDDLERKYKKELEKENK